MSEWQAVGVVSEGQPITVEGVNPWLQQWRRVDQPPVELPHPSHRHQLHPFPVYEMSAGAKPVVFAAQELSAGVWGFYVHIGR